MAAPVVSSPLSAALKPKVNTWATTNQESQNFRTMPPSVLPELAGAVPRPAWHVPTARDFGAEIRRCICSPQKRLRSTSQLAGG